MINTFVGVLHNWWWNPDSRSISGDIYESPYEDDGTWVTTWEVMTITTRKVCDYIQNVNLGEPDGYLVRGSTSQAFKISTRNSEYELGIPMVLALPKEG